MEPMEILWLDRLQKTGSWTTASRPGGGRIPGRWFCQGRYAGHPEGRRWSQPLLGGRKPHAVLRTCAKRYKHSRVSASGDLCGEQLQLRDQASSRRFPLDSTCQLTVQLAMRLGPASGSDGTGNTGTFIAQAVAGPPPCASPARTSLERRRRPRRRGPLSVPVSSSLLRKREYGRAEIFAGLVALARAGGPGDERSRRGSAATGSRGDGGDGRSGPPHRLRGPGRRGRAGPALQPGGLVPAAAAGPG